MSAVVHTNEVNGLSDGLGYHKERNSSPEKIQTVDWTVSGLEITRLRFLTDPYSPVYDVSYVHGILNGKHVNVRVPFDQLPKRGMKSALFSEAKMTGKFIKGLFNSISTLE